MLPWLEAFANLAVVFGLALTAWQVRKTAQNQRASYLFDLQKMFYDNQDRRDAFYLVEYGKFTYDEEFHGSELEKKIDDFLAYLNLLCLLRKQQLLSDSEMSVFEYNIRRTVENPAIQEYFKFLRQWTKNLQESRHSFSDLEEYGRRKGWIREAV